MMKTLLVATLAILSATAPDADARERGGDLKLSDAQKSQLEEIKKNCANRDKCRQQFESILTTEQREQMSQQRGGRPDGASRQSRPESAGRGRPR